MVRENEPHQLEIDSAIAEAAERIKTSVLNHLKEKLPVLPKYNEFVTGFENSFKNTTRATEYLRSGMRVTPWFVSHDKGMIVLEEDGMHEVPFKVQGSQMKPDWSAIREATPLDYIQYAEVAMVQIDHWALISERNLPVLSL